MADARLDFFGLPGPLAALDQPVAEPAHEVKRLVARAWYLRQRDTGAALADARTAHDLLGALPADEAQRARGRLALVRAENAWLFGEPDTARGQVGEARRIFLHMGDAEGLGDCDLCEAIQMDDSAANDQAPERLAAVRAAGAAYARGAEPVSDPARLALVDAWTLYLELAAAKPQTDPAPWAVALAQAQRLEHAGVGLFVAKAHARLAELRGHRAEGIEYLHAAFQAALAAGQLHGAIMLAHQIGQAFGRHGDTEGALQWVQRARDLVQATGWPRAACHCLVQAALVHLELGRERAARDLLMNHLPTLQRFPVSPDYVQAAQVLGQALLALREPHDALSWIEVSARVAAQLRLHGELAASLCLKARALSQLGRADEALASGQAALRAAHALSDARREAGVLRVMAEVARAHGLAMPADPQQAADQEVNAALCHMRQAFAMAERAPGFFVPPAWHAEFSQDHQAVGDLALALQHQRLAVAGFEQMHRQQKADLEAVLCVRHRIEAEAMASAQQRALSLAGRDRVALQQAHEDTLERLARALQDLACSTDDAGLFAALGRHVDVLLEPRMVAVWRRHGSAGDVLDLAWGAHDQQPLRPTSLPAGDGAPPWRCLQGRQELLIDGPANTFAAARNGPAHGSALLLPLLAGGDVLGVLVVESRHVGAFGTEREREVPRCLAAAIAQALAGVARRERPAPAATDLDPQRLQDLFAHTGKVAAVARLATLVAGGVAAPPAQGDVRSVFEEARGLYGARLTTEHIVCDEAIPPLTVKADPDRLSLTIANLVFNAADAMEGRPNKHLWLSAVQQNGEIALSVRDNGPGLPGSGAVEPISTAGAEIQGVRPGLVLAAQSVAAMKGRFMAGNASEGGAVFTIVLPAA